MIIGSTTASSYVDNTEPIGSNSYYVIIDANGDYGLQTNTLSLTGTSTISPTFISSSSTTVNARDPINFSVTTTGSPAASIIEAGSLPVGVSFKDNGNGTATFSGQASTNNKGIYFTTLTATNSAGSTTQNFVLSINDSQEAPTFLSTDSVTENVGSAFNFNVDTTGDPVPTIAKTGNLPSTIKFSDNGDGTATLSGTPIKAGIYTLTLKAKNKNGIASQVLTLNVD
jgi:hypothetical protein